MTKKKNTVFIILALFMAILTVTVAVETYALFETNAYIDKNIEIAKWKIKVNGTNISEQRTISLSDFTYINGSHTQNNYFAPGSTLYFDIVIDASNSDVSVLYDLDVDDAAIAEHSNIQFKITNLSTNEEILDNHYSDLIMLNDSNRVVTLRINLVWENLDTYDEADTNLIGQELEFTINANFEQYVGE